MANFLDQALEILVAIKTDDAAIAATAVGDEVTIDVPEFDVPIRLKGGHHVHVTSVTVKRTK